MLLVSFHQSISRKPGSTPQLNGSFLVSHPSYIRSKAQCRLFSYSRNPSSIHKYPCNLTPPCKSHNPIPILPFLSARLDPIYYHGIGFIPGIQLYACVSAAAAASLASRVSLLAASSVSVRVCLFCWSNLLPNVPFGLLAAFALALRISTH